MKWTTTIAIALVPGLAATLACSRRDAHAAAPKTASKLPDEPHPMTPPPADANAASRKPLETTAPPEPRATERPPSPPTPHESAPPNPQANPQAPAPGAPTPPAPGSQAGEEEWLLTDEDAAIPTQEEANQEAALSIDEENADEELAKLEKELAEGGGG